MAATICPLGSQTPLRSGFSPDLTRFGLSFVAALRPALCERKVGHRNERRIREFYCEIIGIVAHEARNPPS